MYSHRDFIPESKLLWEGCGGVEGQGEIRHSETAPLQNGKSESPTQTKYFTKAIKTEQRTALLNTDTLPCCYRVYTRRRCGEIYVFSAVFFKRSTSGFFFFVLNQFLQNYKLQDLVIEYRVMYSIT